MVNPIQSGALKNINVRKVKNDKADAHKIALLYRLKVLRPFQVPADRLRGLRLLCRQRSEVMKNITRIKNHLTALLDQIFPGYDKVFADVGGVSSLAVLDAYPTPQLLLNDFPILPRPGTGLVVVLFSSTPLSLAFLKLSLILLSWSHSIAPLLPL